jgi:hypothetical protein
MNRGSVRGICCSSGDFIVNMKKIGAGAAAVSALAFTAVGISAGVASADQPVPSSPGMTWKLDKPHWDDWDDDDWDDGWRGGPRWDGPGYYGVGPCVWVPPAVSVWVPPAVC